MLTNPQHLPRVRRRPCYSKQKRHHRQEIRADSEYRCVYCDRLEREAGGEESMVIDHFRPQSKYDTLKHNPGNLVWSCGKCNQYKGNDWPAHGLADDVTILGKEGYVDPFLVDRKEYFDVSDDGSFKPRQPPAEYMIRKLKLNRPYVRRARGSRGVIYQTLLTFRSEIEEFRSIIANENMTERDKLRWIQERPAFSDCLDAVNTLGEVLSLD